MRKCWIFIFRWCTHGDFVWGYKTPIQVPRESVPVCWMTMLFVHLSRCSVHFLWSSCSGLVALDPSLGFLCVKTSILKEWDTIFQLWMTLLSPRNFWNSFVCCSKNYWNYRRETEQKFIAHFCCHEIPVINSIKGMLSQKCAHFWLFCSIVRTFVSIYLAAFEKKKKQTVVQAWWDLWFYPTPWMPPPFQPSTKKGPKSTFPGICHPYEMWDPHWCATPPTDMSSSPPPTDATAPPPLTTPPCPCIVHGGWRQREVPWPLGLNLWFCVSINFPRLTLGPWQVLVSGILWLSCCICFWRQECPVLCI